MDEHRQKLEKALVGAMLYEPRAIDAATRYGTDATWFTDATARTAAVSILERYAAGSLGTTTIDIERATGIPEQWMMDAIDICTPSSIDTYCTTLSGYVKIQKIASFARTIAARVNGAQPEDAGDVAATVEAELHRMLSGGAVASGTMRQHANDWLDRMTAADQASTLLDWPLRCVTDAVGRVDRELIWLCAQPSIGKTAFILQWMTVLAKLGHISSLASLESACDSVASRFVAMTAPMDTFPIRQRHAALSELEQARKAANALSDLMHVTDSGMTLDQIYAWGRAEVRKGSKLLMIDNTRHVRITGAEGRIDHVAQMSSRFKQLRDDTKTPVIVLHHSKVDKDGKEDVSWSSDVRRDADMLVFLREDSARTVTPKAIGDPGLWCVLFDVEKNREGRKGVRVAMEFKKQIQTFERWI